VIVAQFEERLFGWMLKYYSYNRNGGSSYSGVRSSNENIFYGVIPEDILDKTHAIKVNDIEAATI